jgi:hypothetical protein
MPRSSANSIIVSQPWVLLDVDHARFGPEATVMLLVQTPLPFSESDAS